MKNITKAGIIIAGIMAASTFAACSSTTNPTAVGTSTSSGENGNIGISGGINVDAGESSSMSIAGNYKGIECGFVGKEKTTDEEFSLTLNEDGTGSHKRNNSEFELTWNIENGEFKMTEKYLSLTIDYTGSLDGKKLTIYNGDPKSELTYEYVYEKE